MVSTDLSLMKLMHGRAESAGSWTRELLLLLLVRVLAEWPDTITTACCVCNRVCNTASGYVVIPERDNAVPSRTRPLVPTVA